MKRAPLVRKAPIKRVAFKPVKVPMQRTSMKRKTTKRDNEFSPAVRKAAEARSGGRCEAQTTNCVQRATVHHHRWRRGQGGRGTLENDLHCCDPCHRHIHDHPAEAFEKGWLLRPPPVMM